MNGEAGKGDTYRPIDQEKYARNYLRIFGVKCPHCDGAGMFKDANGMKSEQAETKCLFCNGVGYVETPKK